MGKRLADEPVASVAGLLAAITTIATWDSVSPADYLACIHTHTLIMLFCLMFVVAGLRAKGVLPARPINAVDMGERQTLRHGRVGALGALLALCLPVAVL